MIVDLIKKNGEEEMVKNVVSIFETYFFHAHTLPLRGSVCSRGHASRGGLATWSKKNGEEEIRW